MTTSNRTVSADQERLQGVWQVVEVGTVGSNASTNNEPQPGLYLFIGNHYSATFVQGDVARAAPADESKATADELRDLLRFGAQAGTYEISGGDLILHPIVALRPTNMASRSKATVSYKLGGNTLWLTRKSTQSGPVTNPSTSKLTRIG